MTTTATAITTPTMSQILPVRLLQSTTREASSLPSQLVRVASPRQERGLHLFPPRLRAEDPVRPKHDVEGCFGSKLSGGRDPVRIVGASSTTGTAPVCHVAAGQLMSSPGSVPGEAAAGAQR